MVSTASLLFMVLSLLLIFLFPISLAVYMYKKHRISLKALFIGAAVFIVFQLLTRIPLLSVLSSQPWYQPLAQNLLFSAVIIGGLTAGLFEEVGRYLGFRFTLKNELSWKNGIAFGIGHGGIEAIVLIGLTYINNIVWSIMINNGTFDSAIAPQIGVEMANHLKHLLIATPPTDFLLAGLERVFAVTSHIAFSLIVLYGVMKRKSIYVLYAILLHTALNAPAVIIIANGFSTWVAELYLFIFAVTAAIFIVKSKRLFEQIPGDPPL